MNCCSRRARHWRGSPNSPRRCSASVSARSRPVAGLGRCRTAPGDPDIGRAAIRHRVVLFGRRAANSRRRCLLSQRTARSRIGSSRISRRARSQPSRRPSNSSGCSRRPASRRHRPIASHPTSCCNDSCSGARRPVRRRTPNSEEQQEEWYKCMLIGGSIRACRVVPI